MKCFRSIVFLLIFLGSAMGPRWSASSELESSVCGLIQEPFAFWLFHRAAGRPDSRRIRGIRAVDRLTFVTTDGRTLGGYRLRADNPRGYLLLAQGNAMLADQILAALSFFRTLGLDVYVYDYRGYGLSGGKSRLKAIVSDYRELITALNGKGYRKQYLYGMSMGGIILLNAVGKTGIYDALVVDSSPSRVSGYGCPSAYDPLANLPEEAAGLMIILGLRDQVVHPEEIRPLVEAAQVRGARVLVSEDFAHPFQDLDPVVHRRRFQAVAEFILTK